MQKKYLIKKILNKENMRKKTKNKSDIKRGIVSVFAACVLGSMVMSTLVSCKPIGYQPFNPNVGNEQETEPETKIEEEELDPIEQQYKIMAEDKLKVLLSKYLNLKYESNALEFPVEFIDNLVINFNSGIVYFNAHSTGVEDKLFFFANFGNEISSVNSYEDLCFNLDEYEKPSLAIATIAVLPDYIDNQKVINFNKYILNKVGINYYDAKILNIRPFFVSGVGIAETQVIIIHDKQIKTIIASTNDKGLNEKNIDAILSGNFLNIEISSTDCFSAHPIPEQEFSK